MAWATKYRCEFKDVFQSNTVRIDFEKDGYGGSVITLRPLEETFELQTEDQPWVVSTEMLLSFIVNENDVTAYDADFFDSTYKDVRVKYYLDGTLQNVFWLKPANATRDYFGPERVYQVSATDGLNDLKDVDYEGFSEAGRETGLTIIKNALDNIGITDLDFYIQCNLYEDVLMLPGDNVFEDLYFSNNAFYKIENGEQRPVKCYDVLERIIKSFYCRLYQQGGYWKILNGQEYVSEYNVFDYATLAVSSAGQAADRTVDITNHKRPADSPWELSHQPAVKTLRLTLRNKNLGDNELTNGDFSGGLTGWNNGPSGSDWYQFQVVSGELQCFENKALGDPNSEMYFESDSFYVNQGEGDGYFEYSFKLELHSLIYDTGDYTTTPPYVRIRLIYPNASYVETPNIVIQQGSKIYTTYNIELFSLDQTGDYTLRIIYHPHSSSDINSIDLRFDDIEVTQTATADSTFDSLFKNVLTAEAYKEEEETIYFADDLQRSNIAALTDASSSGSLTSSWTRYGASGEAQSLLYLFAQQYLNDHRGNDLLSAEILDVDETIDVTSILIWNGKYYRWLDCNKNNKTKLISGTLAEVDNTSDVAFSPSQITLTTIDGQSTETVQGSATIESYWFESTNGIYTNQNVGVGRVPSGTFGLEVNDAAYIGGNIGLGTTDVESWHAQYRVIESAQGAVMLANTATNPWSLLLSNAYYDGAWKYKTTNPAGCVSIYNGLISLSVAPSGSLDTLITWTLGLRIDNSGNCGVQNNDIEAWPSNYGAIEMPEVSLMFTKATLNPGLWINENAYNDGSWKYKSTHQASQIELAGGVMIFRTAATGTVNTAISWTDALKIGNAGYLHLTKAPAAGSSPDLILVRNASAGQIRTIAYATFEPAITAGTTAQYWRGDKTWQTLNTTAVTEGSNLYFTDERAQDATGTMIANTQTVNLTYADATPALTADVNYQMSITADAGGLKLDGDAASPGNSKLYGTDASGNKGWYASLWTPDANGIHYSSGNVGIGGNAQTGNTKLYVYNDTYDSVAEIRSNTDNATLKLEANYGGTGGGITQDPRIIMKSANVVKAGLYYDNTASLLYIGSGVAGTEFAFDIVNTRLGVGTSSPGVTTVINGVLSIGPDSLGGGIRANSTLYHEINGSLSAQLWQNTNDSGAAELILGKTRGTSYGSNTIVLVNDCLGSISWYGGDGGLLTPTLGAKIAVWVDGTPANTIIPSKMSFYTSNTSGSKIERMNLRADGAVNIFGPVTFSSTITTQITDSRAVITNSSNQLMASAVTSVELGYLQGATSNIQNQIDTMASSGTWTPTLTGVSNVSSSTAWLSHYSKTDNVVSCAGRIDVTPASGSTLTEIRISLPVASDFDSALNCSGVANIYRVGVSMATGNLTASVANDTAVLDFMSIDTNSHNIYFVFMYRIL